jgi:hypothetical protein
MRTVDMSLLKDWARPKIEDLDCFVRVDLRLEIQWMNGFHVRSFLAKKISKRPRPFSPRIAIS